MAEVMPHFGSSSTVTGIQQGLFQTFKQWGPELKSGMGGVVWAKGLDYSGAKGPERTYVGWLRVQREFRCGKG